MPESGIPHKLIEDDVSDYVFVGDIAKVYIFLFHSVICSTHANFYWKQVILMQDANIHRNPYILASGIADNIDLTNLTFTLSPSQYINLPHTVLDCPLSCFFDLDSKKWKNKKPMPTTGVLYLLQEC
jgi:hypothetical protein